MKSKKGFICILLLILILIYSYLSIFSDLFKNNILLNYLFLILLIITGIYIINIVLNKEKIINLTVKDKLLTSLVKSFDTIYIMINAKNNKILYLSNNTLEILGIKKNNIQSTALEILNIPMIKQELSNWNKKGIYVSQLFEYNNPLYNHQMWIRVKMYSYQENSNEYYVIQVLDATKEHDRQHLLITQATNIKEREAQLNQITKASYDIEININLFNSTYDLKYFKKDNMYFGEEKRGNYKEGLQTILGYINENDKDMVYNNLSLENLKEHFDKYELDSIVIRYRLGNEIKNNIWLESTIFFLSNRHNKKVSILTRNVTENAESIREQNVMLQNALNNAKMADKSKTELISTISHDIRTPLTNIIGLSESLLNKKIESSVKEDILNINDSSKEVLNIIDDLLEPSKIEKRVIKKDEKNYSILKMFKKIEQSTKEYIGNKAIKFNLNLDNNLPVILYGDYKRITEALIQIVNNSIKYTDEGEINVSVKGLRKDNNINLIVTVIDTGRGIEEEKLNSIMNSKGKNTGISTVKSLMELLDGTLEIESKVGEYTKVIVSYNQRIVEDNKVAMMMKNNKEAEEFDLSGKKILIVDDNKLNLKVTSRMLESYKVSTVLVESGEECIDIVKEQGNFDLILLDILMPGLDGIATLNKLKEMNIQTPTVALTADAMEGRKNEYLSQGFDDYISKPIDRKELSRVLKKFLKKI